MQTEALLKYAKANCQDVETEISNILFSLRSNVMRQKELSKRMEDI
jgi:hypothetical protein